MLKTWALLKFYTNSQLTLEVWKGSVETLDTQSFTSSLLKSVQELFIIWICPLESLSSVQKVHVNTEVNIIEWVNQCKSHDGSLFWLLFPFCSMRYHGIMGNQKCLLVEQVPIMKQTFLWINSSIVNCLQKLNWMKISRLKALIWTCILSLQWGTKIPMFIGLHHHEEGLCPQWEHSLSHVWLWRIQHFSNSLFQSCPHIVRSGNCIIPVAIYLGFIKGMVR